MPKALMLCYYYPPVLTIGTTRSLEFSRLLPKYSWSPVVLTVKDSKDPWVKRAETPIPEGVRVERTAEWNLAGLCDFVHGSCSRIAELFGKDLKTNYFRELICMPDPQIAWSSTRRGVELAKECDVIYASCSPYSSAISACKIKRETGKPVVLDFRDPWTVNPYPTHRPLHRSLARRLERSVLKAADHVILNTSGTLELYRKSFPEYQEKFSAIPNGYDKLTPVQTMKSADAVFTIVHVGTFFGDRSPRLLLEALAELPELNVEFVQVGGTFDDADRFKDKVRMKIIEAVPRDRAIELMQEASLLFLQTAAAHTVVVSGKTYEYIATGLPILADVAPGDNAEIIRNYAANYYLLERRDKEEMKAAITSAYNDRGKVTPHIKPEYIRDFDRSLLAAELCKVLESVLPANARPISSPAD